MGKKEIDNKLDELRILKDRIEYYKSEKREIRVKNFLKGAIVASPFVFVAAILGTKFVLDKNIPGHIDYIEKHAYNTIYYSSIDGKTVTTEYVGNSFSSTDKDKMIYYGPWVEQEDGTYSCGVKEYELYDVTESQINRLIEREDLTFEDMLSLSVKSVEEKEYFKNSVTQEELEMGSHFEITVYDENKADTTMAKESEDDNKRDIGLLVGGFLFAFAVEIFILGFSSGDVYLFDSAKDENKNIKYYKAAYKELEKELEKIKVKKK